jgi:enamine deaminase RidA (YjgF/YER057c/UK114 family)
MHFARILATIVLVALLTPVNSRGAVSETHLSFIEPDPATGTSKAVITDNLSLVHTSQILPFDAPGQIIAPDAHTQARRILTVISGILINWNSGYTTITKLNIYIRDTNALPLVQQALASTFKGSNKPAASFVITKLPNPDALVAMDAVAVPRLHMNDPKAWRTVMPSGPPWDHEIHPAAGLTTGPLVYVSGMADTNSLPEATRLTLSKLMTTIGHLGLSAADVVQLKAFFQPMSDAAVVRKEIVNFFHSNAPPTVFVEWISPAPNPPIEIELIAAGRADSTNENESVVFLTPPGTTSTKVFSRVTKVNRGKLIYISGLYGMNAHDADSEVGEIFQSLGKVLESTGSDFEHLVKATYYVSDDLAGNKLNEIRPQFFNPLRAPAASKAKVRGVAAPHKSVTLDMIAVTK